MADMLEGRKAPPKPAKADADSTTAHPRCDAEDAWQRCRCACGALEDLPQDQGVILVAIHVRGCAAPRAQLCAVPAARGSPPGRCPWRDTCRPAGQGSTGPWMC